MKIITAADKNYNYMLTRSMSMNARQGYSTLNYDLGGSFGKPYDVTHDMALIKSKDTPYTGTAMMKSIFKPRIILDALRSNPDEQRFAWIDADAYCIQQIHMIMYRKVWDIAVTMRRPGENQGSAFPMFDAYINAGVILLRNNPRVHRFLQDWIDLIPYTQTLVDQEALNILLHAVKMTECNAIYEVDKLKVMLLTTDEYNFYYFPEEPGPDARVLHFKGMKDGQQLKYFNHYLPDETARG